MLNIFKSIATSGLVARCAPNIQYLGRYTIRFLGCVTAGICALMPHNADANYTGIKKTYTFTTQAYRTTNFQKAFGLVRFADLPENVGNPNPDNCVTGWSTYCQHDCNDALNRAATGSNAILTLYKNGDVRGVCVSEYGVVMNMENAVKTSAGPSGFNITGAIFQSGSYYYSKVWPNVIWAGSNSTESPTLEFVFSLSDGDIDYFLSCPSGYTVSYDGYCCPSVYVDGINTLTQYWGGDNQNSAGCYVYSSTLFNNTMGSYHYEDMCLIPDANIDLFPAHPALN